MIRRLAVLAVNAVAWPLCRVLSAWDAADRRHANRYAVMDQKDDR